MAKCGYTIQAPWTALAAGVGKTLLQVAIPSTFGLELKKIRIGCNGVSAAAVPGVIELITATAAGASSTSASVQQLYGRTIPHGLTAQHTLTGEPTGIVSVDPWPLTPNGGLVLYDWPLGDSPDFAPSSVLGIRATFPAVVSLMATLWVERI
ncbi:hypothetical protein [Nonomuraea sp. LPB2021202275-12-8]|uniref:hypothetical protein n=1 Tax=Nonomuraea sp. LPB2021202275-12-8 TaxID=3120159 RepID=UPI00300D5400